MSDRNDPSDRQHYYYIYNEINSNISIASGIGGIRSTEGKIEMSQTILSSSNWQLYPQSGRYLIRNYDYGSAYQLGLKDKDTQIPALLPRSGGLGQQWILTQFPDSTYHLMNALLGNSSTLLTLSGDGYPVMDTNSTRGLWYFVLNPEAGRVTNDMLSDVKPFEAGTSSSNTSTTTSTSNTSLPSGAIVGLAVEGAVILLLVAVLFVVLRKRHQNKKVDSNFEVLPQSAKQPYISLHNQQPCEAPDSAPVELDGLGKQGN